MITFIDTSYKAVLDPGGDPFYASLFSLGTAEDWVGYVFGSLFLAIGLLCFFFIPKARRNADRYKDEQLKNYNEQYRRHEVDYSKTGMYLPMGQKMKLQLPAILGVMFLIIGITWLVGHSIQTL